MKTTNEYQKVLSGDFFDKTPKAVFAALAVSLAAKFDGDLSKVEAALKEEWAILHDAGVVSQKPVK